MSRSIVRFDREFISYGNLVLDHPVNCRMQPVIGHANFCFPVVLLN
jgi:hypothetical protein